MERFKFPIFDGDIRKYAKFRSEFAKFVQPLCSANQLPFVLKSYLCESVRKDVENFDYDIDLMWQRLDLKYGAEQKLIDCIMFDIKNLPKSDNDPKTVLEIIRLIAAAHNDLKCINATNELRNSTILSLIEQHMPSVMYEEWVKLIVKVTPLHKFDKLLPFLQDWKIRIEYENADIRTFVTERSPSMFTDSRKCLIHRDCEHPVRRCRVFRSLSIAERINVVKTRNACTLCLETGHNTVDCKKVSKCSKFDCNKKHNVLLHDNYSTACNSVRPGCFSSSNS